MEAPEELVAAVFGEDPAAAAAARQRLMEVDEVLWKARFAVLDAPGGGSADAAVPLIRDIVALYRRDALEGGELLVSAARRVERAQGRAAGNEWIDRAVEVLDEAAWQPLVLLAAYELERVREGTRHARVEVAVEVLERIDAGVVRSYEHSGALAERVVVSVAALLERDAVRAGRVLLAVSAWLEGDPRAQVLALQAAEAFASAGALEAASAAVEHVWDVQGEIGVRARAMSVSLQLARGSIDDAGSLLQRWEREVAVRSGSEQLVWFWLAAERASRAGDAVQELAALSACCAVLCESSAAARTSLLRADDVVRAASFAGVEAVLVADAARALQAVEAAGRGAVEVLAGLGDVEGVVQISERLSADAWVAAEVVRAKAIARDGAREALWEELDAAAAMADGLAEKFRVAEIALQIESPRAKAMAHGALAAALAAQDRAMTAIAADLAAYAGVEHGGHVEALLAAIERCVQYEPVVRVLMWLQAVVTAPVAARAGVWEPVAALAAEIATQTSNGELLVLAGWAALPFSVECATSYAIEAAVHPEAEAAVRMLLEAIGSSKQQS